MKRLLVKIANKIMNKYGIIHELHFGDTVLVNNRTYVINKIKTSKEYFKHDLVIEASDLIPFNKEFAKPKTYDENSSKL